MNIRELKCFKVVYEENSINRAAKKLYITSQGLGRIIANLEKELDTQLFERSAKGVRPTNSAEILYDNVNQLIDQFTLITSAIKQSNEKESKLSIDCASGVLIALSFQVLSNFIEKHPDIEVTWKETSNENAKHEISLFLSDIALVVGKVTDEDIVSELVGKKEAIVLVYKGHRLFDKEVLTIHELIDEDLITLNENYQIYHDFIAACRKHNMAPNIVAMTQDSLFLYKLCKQKVGLGILLDFSAETLLLDEIRAIPLQANISWDIYMIYHNKNRKYKNMKVFRDYIRKELC
jgi:DNA-binding transcriptional LysR family regulator